MGFLAEAIVFAGPAVVVSLLLRRRTPGRSTLDDREAIVQAALVCLSLVLGQSVGALSVPLLYGAEPPRVAVVTAQFAGGAAAALAVLAALRWREGFRATAWIPRGGAVRESIAAVAVGLALVFADRLLEAALSGSRLPEGLYRQTQLPEVSGDSTGEILVLAGVAIVAAPVVEELIFRGFVFTRLESAFGARAAAGLSATAFALLHYEAYLPIFVKAIAFSALFLRRRSLVGPTIAHAVNNAVWLLLLSAGTP